MTESYYTIRLKDGGHERTEKAVGPKAACRAAYGTTYGPDEAEYVNLGTRSPRYLSQTRLRELKAEGKWKPMPGETRDARLARLAAEKPDPNPPVQVSPEPGHCKFCHAKLVVTAERCDTCGRWQVPENERTEEGRALSYPTRPGLYLLCEDLAAALIGPFDSLKQLRDHQRFLKERGDTAIGQIVFPEELPQILLEKTDIMQYTPQQDRDWGILRRATEELECDVCGGPHEDGKCSPSHFKTRR